MVVELCPVSFTAHSLFFSFKKKYSFIWLHWILAAACGIQFPNQGSNLGSLQLGGQSLSHWTTREVPQSLSFQLLTLYSMLIFFLFLVLLFLFFFLNTSKAVILTSCAFKQTFEKLIQTYHFLFLMGILHMFTLEFIFLQQPIFLMAIVKSRKHFFYLLTYMFFMGLVR